MFISCSVGAFFVRRFQEANSNIEQSENGFGRRRNIGGADSKRSFADHGGDVIVKELTASTDYLKGEVPHSLCRR